MLIDLSKPPYDQDTFEGRCKHFLRLTNPLNIVKSDSALDQARDTVNIYREKGILPAGGESQLWEAKYLYDSAHHPETGDRQNLVGRMSFQVPGGMVITGLLLAFYRTPLEIFLGQWLNQSFNALVNYTNRSGDKALPTSTIGLAYFSATTCATVTAIGFNKYGLKPIPTSLLPLFQRFVPFVAVAAANAVNIPLMRNRELIDGIPVLDEDGNKVGTSRIAAKEAITKCTISRISMAAPGMLICPIIVESLEKKGIMKLGKMASCAFQTTLIGGFLLIMVPVGCSLYSQRQSISVEDLEPELRDRIKSQNKDISLLYYNKGL